MGKSSYNGGGSLIGSGSRSWFGVTNEPWAEEADQRRIEMNDMKLLARRAQQDAAATDETRKKIEALQSGQEDTHDEADWAANIAKQFLKERGN